MPELQRQVASGLACHGSAPRCRTFAEGLPSCSSASSKLHLHGNPMLRLCTDAGRKPGLAGALGLGGVLVLLDTQSVTFLKG